RTCPQPVHRLCCRPLTGAPEGSLAPRPDLGKSELAERDCGAAERATGTRSGQKAPGGWRTRGNPDFFEPGGNEEDPKPSWGDLAKPKVPLDLESSDPPTDLVQRAVFRATEAPPSCYGRCATAPPRSDAPR